MVELKVISYEEERLMFFMEQMEKAKKRYERLNRTYTDDSYLSEATQKLADAGRELQFYEDIIAMLKAEEFMTRQHQLVTSEAYARLVGLIGKELAEKLVEEK